MLFIGVKRAKVSNKRLTLKKRCSIIRMMGLLGGIIFAISSVSMAEEAKVNQSISDFHRSQFKVVCQEGEYQLEGYGVYVHKDGWAIIPKDIGEGFVRFKIVHNDDQVYECVDLYTPQDSDFILIKTNAPASSITRLKFSDIAPSPGDPLYVTWPQQQKEEVIEGLCINMQGVGPDDGVGNSQVLVSAPIKVNQIGSLAVDQKGNLLGVMTLYSLDNKCYARIISGHLIQNKIDEIIHNSFSHNKPYAEDLHSGTHQGIDRIKWIESIKKLPRYLDRKCMWRKVQPCIATVVSYDFYGREINRSYGFMLPEYRDTTTNTSKSNGNSRTGSRQAQYNEAMRRRQGYSRSPNPRSRGGRSGANISSTSETREKSNTKGDVEESQNSTLSDSMVISRESVLQAEYVEVSVDHTHFKITTIVGENKEEGWMLVELPWPRQIDPIVSFNISKDKKGDPTGGFVCCDCGSTPEEWYGVDVEYEKSSGAISIGRQSVSNQVGGGVPSPEKIPPGSPLLDSSGRIVGVCNNVRHEEKAVFTPLSKLVKGKTSSSIKFSEWLKDNKKNWETPSNIVAKRESAEMLMPSLEDILCEVIAYDGQGHIMNMGTGFLVNAFGHCITSYAVIEGAEKVVIRRDGKEYDEVSIVAFSRQMDLVQLESAKKIENIAFLPLASIAYWGEQSVYIGGSIRGITSSILNAEISGLQKNDPAIKGNVLFYDTNVALPKYYLGGPAINGEGNIIGFVRRYGGMEEGRLAAARNIFRLRHLFPSIIISEDIWGLNAMDDLSKSYRMNAIRKTWFTPENMAFQKDAYYHNLRSTRIERLRDSYNQQLSSFEEQATCRRSIRYPSGASIRPGIYEFCGHVFTENELGFILQELGIPINVTVLPYSLEDHIWMNYCDHMERLNHNLDANDDIMSDGTGFISCPLCRGRGYLVLFNNEYVYPDPPEIGKSTGVWGSAISKKVESGGQFIPFQYPKMNNGLEAFGRNERKDGDIVNKLEREFRLLSPKVIYPYVRINCPAKCYDGKIICPSVVLLPRREETDWREACDALHQMFGNEAKSENERGVK